MNKKCARLNETARCVVNTLEASASSSSDGDADAAMKFLVMARSELNAVLGTMTPKKLLKIIDDLDSAGDTLEFCMNEHHADEVANGHYGDGAGGCSYCAAIKAWGKAHDAFEQWKQKETMP